MLNTFPQGIFVEYYLQWHWFFFSSLFFPVFFKKMYISLWKKLVDPANWLKASRFRSRRCPQEMRKTLTDRCLPVVFMNHLFHLPSFRWRSLTKTRTALWVWTTWPGTCSLIIRWYLRNYFSESGLFVVKQDFGSGGKFPAAVQAWCACTLLNLTSKGNVQLNGHFKVSTWSISSLQGH